MALFRVHFQWKEKEYELTARSLDLTHPYFVSIKNIVFPKGKKLIIDPSEDEVLDFVLFRVDAGPGPVAPTRRIEKSLRDMAFGLDGDLGVSEDDGAALSLLMQIPAAPERAEVVDARRRAAVFHDDQRVRRTLVAALTHLGWSCDHGSAMVADYALPEDAAVAFADGWATERLRPLDPRVTVVELVARGEAPENEGPSLSIPFELGELEALLERALEGIQE